MNPLIIDMHVHAPIDRREDAALVDRCRRGGVSAVVVSGLGRWNQRPERGEVRLGNQQALDLVRKFDGHAAWLAYLDPQDDAWPGELDRCLRQAAVGIKLWVSLKDSAGRLDRTEQLLREAGRRGLPVLIHTFERTDEQLPGEVNVAETVALALRCPGTLIVAAHAGGGNWQRVLGVLRDAPPKLHVDISGCYPKRGMVEHLVTALGAERVLFGTDLPGRSLASQLAKVMLAEIDEPAREAILWRNAEKIFRLLGTVPEGDCPRSLRGTVIRNAGNPINAKNTGAPISGGLWASAKSPDYSSVSPLKGRGQPPSGTVPHSDHSLFLGNWPTVPDAAMTPGQLDDALKRMNLDAGYVVDLDTLFESDLHKVNLALLEKARSFDRLRPLCIIDPTRNHIDEMVRLCQAQPFAGAWLSPYLHAWKLDEKRIVKLFARLAAAGIPTWLNVALGDHRFRPPQLTLRPVAQHELLRFLPDVPPMNLVVQGADGHTIEAALMQSPPPTRRFDLVRATDGNGALDRLLDRFPTHHFVHGSEYPLRDLHQTLWTLQHEMAQCQ